MLKQHKRTLILTSLVTLLPILMGLLLWNRLEETMITHWGFDGQPDGVSSRAFGVFALPLIMLAAHWLCIGLTTLDHKNAQRNPKPFRVLLWVIPITSNLCCGMMYTLALGLPVSPAIFMNGFLGILFIAIGNYLPKCSQNRTMGIKLPWTFRSVENWNATHRFGGRVWVIGGVVILFSALLPGGWSVGVMAVSIFALALIPTVYSYLYYRRQVRRGDTFTPMAQSEQEKKFAKAFSIGTLIFVPLLLIFLWVVLFTGHVEVSFSQDYFTVDASFYDDLVVYYDRVDSVSYHQGNIPGTRTFGVGSLRLLLGQFENQELGPYTRYTYYDPESCVLLYVNGKPLVLSGRDDAETQQLYRQLLEKTH